MPLFDEEERPRPKTTHEIGQDLSLLSVAELEARIGLMKNEIARLEADIAAKRSTRAAADQVFRR